MASRAAYLGWFVLVWLVALGILLANDPARVFFDTKLGVDINAAGFLDRLWPLWNQREWFGSLQDQYIGYAIPMAPFYLAGQLAHLPTWLIERLWLSLLVAVGFIGLVRLADALGIGSRRSRLAAGAIFALWPTFTIVIGSTSSAALPGLLAPWAVLPLVSAGRRPAAVSAARSGVAILLMGGVNAVCTLAVLILPACYILTHARGRRLARLGLCWCAAVAAATAWWAVPLLLQGRYAYNFLPFIEQAATTTGTMSATAFLRGAGNWTAYFNLGIPWISAGWVMVSSRFAILASALLASTGLYGLARRDMPDRRWLQLSAAAVALIALAGYPGPLGGPLHGPIQDLFNGTLAPFRSVYKLEPVLAVVLALGCAHALGRLWTGELRLPGRPGPPPRRLSPLPGSTGPPPRRLSPLPGRPGRLSVAAVTVPLLLVALAGLALPYLTGQVLQPGSFSRVPGYWYQVADFLAAHSPRQTALVVPGQTHGLYLWGDPIDDPLEPLASSPWAERALVPYGGAGSQVFLDTVQSAISSGGEVPGLPSYLARAGIRYVVVRNDLSPSMLGYVQPQLVHRTLARSGFRHVAAFGPLITGAQTDPRLPPRLQALLPSYRAVQVYEASTPAQRPAGPAVALPVSNTVLVNGGPDALLQLAGQWILGRQPAVIAGDRAAGPPQLWAVTDGQRRADQAFGLISSDVSFTYTATETNPPDDPLGGAGAGPRQILPVPAAGHQTVAVLTGAAQVTASSYGSWLVEAPQYDPVNAFDGNPATAWAEGDPDTPVGQWIQITFDHPMNLPARLGIRLLDDSPARSVASQLQVSTAAGRATTNTAATNAVQPLRAPAGRTSWLRITITGARNVLPGAPGAGIRDVLIPGVRVTRYLQPPESPAGRAAPSAVFSFQQQIAAAPVSGAAAQPMARTFSTAGPLRMRVVAAAAAVQGPALQRLLNRLTPASRAELRVSTNSGQRPDAPFGPDNLFGRAGQAPWIADSAHPVIRLSWHGDRRIAAIRLTPAYGEATAPDLVRVASPAGARTAGVGLGGLVQLVPPLTTNRMSVSFPGARSASAPGAAGGQPSRLPIGLARMSIPALAGLRPAVPKAASRFTLSCGGGPGVTVDGRSYKTAVTGTIGALNQSQQVRIRLCTPGSAIRLSAGRHWLLALPSRTFEITSMNLRSPPGPAPLPGRAAPQRVVTVLSWQPDNRTLRIGGGAAAYLEVHQNANPGWVATLNGRPLTAARLDGWQQAFVVPAGRGGIIRLTFTPATVYHVGLLVSAAAIVALLGVAYAPRPRRRAVGRPERASVSNRAGFAARTGPAAGDRAGITTPAGPTAADLARITAQAGPAGRAAGNRAGSTMQAGPVGQVRAWAGIAVLTGIIAIAGGLVAMVVPVLAAVGARRPRLVPALAFGGMLAAGIIAASAVQPTAPGSGAFGGFAQACALTALAAALLPTANPWRGRAAGLVGQAGQPAAAGDPDQARKADEAGTPHEAGLPDGSSGPNGASTPDEARAPREARAPDEADTPHRAPDGSSGPDEASTADGSSGPDEANTPDEADTPHEAGAPDGRSGADEARAPRAASAPDEACAAGPDRAATPEPAS